MKKRIIALVLAVVLVLSLSLTLAACNGATNFTYANAKEYKAAHQAEISERVTALEIGWINGNVKVQTKEADGKIEIRETVDFGDTSEKTTMHYLVKNGTLHIQYAKSGYIKLGKLQKTLEVFIPSDYALTEVDAETVSANVTISDLALANVDCETVSGSVDIVQCSMREIDCETTSGDVGIMSAVNNVSVKTVSGGVNVTPTSQFAEIELETVSGDCELMLLVEYGFRIDFDTVSGVFSSAFPSESTDRNFTFKHLDGAALVEVETVSGSLSLLGGNML